MPHFPAGSHESEREREREESQELPSAIYEVLSVEIHRVKNESSLYRRRLCMDTKNFAKDPNEEFGKSKVLSLGSVHEAS